MKAMNLERENFGFLNVFYVEDNPVMGYDNKGLVPDWCKCKKGRNEWMENCLRSCNSNGFSYSQGIFFSALCSAVSGAVGGGFIIGGISGVLCNPQFWCFLVCNEEERKICEPEIPSYLPNLGPGWEAGPIY